MTRNMFSEAAVKCNASYKLIVEILWFPVWFCNIPPLFLQVSFGQRRMIVHRQLPICFVSVPTCSIFRDMDDIFRSKCTLANRMVGTTWWALCNPRKRRKGLQLCDLWLLGGTPTALGPYFASWLLEHKLFIRMSIKPRPWGIKGANISFLPNTRISQAAKSFTPVIGIYV